MKKANKTNSMSASKSPNNIIISKSFYEFYYSPGLRLVIYNLNILLFILFFSATLPVMAQTAIRGGKQKVPLTPTGGANNESTANIINNTMHDMWDLKIIVFKQGKIKTSSVAHGTKTDKGPNQESKSVHIKFTSAVKKGETMRVKTTFTSPNDSVIMIPTDTLGADLMIDKNENAGIDTIKKATGARSLKIKGGKQQVKTDGSNFPAVDFTNETGQDICDLKIMSAKTASNGSVKIDSVFVNDKKVYGGPATPAVHVYFPCVAANGTFKVTVKFQGSSEVVTCAIVPTNKDSADIATIPQSFKKENGSGSKKPGKHILFPENYQSLKTSTTFINNTGTGINEFIISAARKIKALKVNGINWSEDGLNISDTLKRFIGPQPGIPDGSGFYLTIEFGGLIGSYDIIPLNINHQIIFPVLTDGAVNRFLMPNQNSSFGICSRSGSIVAINESCSPISQLVFNSPGPGVSISSITSPLPSNIDLGNSTIHFPNPILPGNSFKVEFELNNLLPYSPTDTFPYTIVDFFAPGSLPFDFWPGFSYDIKPATCPAATNGGIELILIGQQNQPGFLWSNGSTQQNLSNVPQGTYNLTIFAPGGCINKTFDVPALLPSAASLNLPASCHGTNDGAAIIITDQFTEPVNFQWSNGQISQTAINLQPGFYQVLISDALGCMGAATANIFQPLPVTVNGTTLNISCAGSKSGSIDLATSGGTGGYSWLWNNGNTNEDRSSLAAGNYTVTATDGAGCLQSASFTVTQSPTMTISFTKVNVKCGGTSTGKITANVSGGTPPYQVNWSNGAAGNPATGLIAGSYIVTVTDANGCSKSKTTVLTENPPITVAINQSGPDAAMANAAGGVPPYTYSWNTIPVQTTPVATGLLPGQTYLLTVKDSKLCTKQAQFSINNMRWVMPAKNIKFSIQTYPNPATSILNIQAENKSTEKFHFELFDITGRKVVEATAILGNTEIYNMPIDQVPGGIYNLKVTSNDTYETITVVIARP